MKWLGQGQVGLGRFAAVGVEVWEDDPGLGGGDTGQGPRHGVTRLVVHSEKWLVSTPPIATTIRRTSKLDAFSAIVLYRLEPPCSMYAK